MKSSPKLLTFEWNEKDEILEIHGNSKGFLELSQKLSKLANKTGNDHDHMMTPDWGGQELTNEPMNPDNLIINHVKIHKWE